MVIQEPTSKVPIPIPVPDVNLLQPAARAEAADPARRSRRCAAWPSSARSRRPMIGLAKAAQSSDVITGSGTLDVLRYGRVLKARQLVGVRGAGLRLRRPLLRPQRHPRHQAGRVQADVLAQPQRDSPVLPGGPRYERRRADDTGVRRLPRGSEPVRRGRRADDMGDGGQKKFFGKYRGTVLSNVDPKRQGRLLVQVARRHGPLSGQLGDAVLPIGGLQFGAYLVPPTGRRRLGGVRAGQPEQADLDGLLRAARRPTRRSPPRSRLPGAPVMVLGTVGPGVGRSSATSRSRRCAAPGSCCGSGGVDR